MGFIESAATVLSSVARHLRNQPELLYGVSSGVLFGGLLENRGASVPVSVGTMLFVWVVSLAVWAWRRRGRTGEAKERTAPREGVALGLRKVRNAKISDVRLIRTGGSVDVRLEDSRRVDVQGIDVHTEEGEARLPLQRVKDTEISGIEVRSERPQAPEPAPRPRAGEARARTLWDERDAVLDAVRGQRELRVAVEADSGCGKTKLLEELNTGLQQAGYLSVFITAQHPAYLTVADAGGRGEAEMAELRESADLDACQALIAKMATDLEGQYSRSHEQLSDRLLAAREAWLSDGAQPLQASLAIENASRVELTNTGFHIQAPSGPQLRLLRMQQRVLTELNRIAGERRLAVLVDDLQFVLGTPVGNWLAGVLNGLIGAVVVHARRPVTGRQVPLADLTVRLGVMGEGETVSYVAEKLDAADWRPEPARACGKEIYQATRGHPFGVVTCTEMVTRTVPANAAPEVARRGFLGGDEVWELNHGAKAIRAYIEDQAEQLIGSQIPGLFDLLLVMRRCPAKVFRGVLDQLGVSESQADRLHDWLRSSAFTAGFDDDYDQGWRLHDYLRENLGTQLAERRRSCWQQTHALVERYYRTVLNFDAEVDQDSPHAAGARFEEPAFQRDSEEWLYHANHLRREEFVGARRTMIRLFVEAFWWWGTEIDSLYCRQLMDAYRLALPAGFDARWIDLLDQFRTGYVAGLWNQKVGQDAERWAQAGRALMELRQLLKITDRWALPTDPDLRRIHIILCILQGDIAWFGSQGTERDREKAINWYRLTAELDADEDEQWIRAWAVWMHASLLVEAGRTEEARELLDRIRDDLADDNELRVLVAGCYGDLAWAEAERAPEAEREAKYQLALDLYTRYVLHGFFYQVEQEVPKQHPNEYSLSIFEGALAHAYERFGLAAELGIEGLAERAEERTRQYFAPYWRHVSRPPEPRRPAFPPPPTKEDLIPGPTSYRLFSS